MSAKVDFNDVRTNADLVASFQLTDGVDPIDLTGSELQMMVRRKVDENQAYVSISTTTSGITVTDAAEGKFQIEIPAATLEKMPAGTYEHDLIRITGGARETAWKGTMKVSRGVTR